jgi:hypothetical protein
MRLFAFVATMAVVVLAGLSIVAVLLLLTILLAVWLV